MKRSCHPARLVLALVITAALLPLHVAWSRAQNQETELALAQAQRLERRGDYAGAAAQYALAADLDPDAAPTALLGQARAALAGGDAGQAGGAVGRLREEYPDTPESVNALFLAARATEAAGDCAGAVEWFGSYERAAGVSALGPYPALARARCLGELADYAGQLRAAESALAAEGGGPRLAQMEALEIAADALLKVGRHAEAQERYERLLGMAATPAYRAEMLFNTATLAHALGRDDQAATRFRTVVVELPTTARAPGALDGLDAMGRGGLVTPYQAGLVRLNARDYAAARVLFEQVQPGSPDYSAARFEHAVARLRSEDDSNGGFAELVALAEQDRAWAGRALLRAGRVHEIDGRASEAEATYARLAQLDPGSSLLPEIQTRLAVLRFGRGDASGSLSAANVAVEPARNASPAVLAQAQLWRGKALARLQGPSSPEARDAWANATATHPDGYYGLRAADLLAGVVHPTNPGAVRSLSVLEPGEEDAAAWAEWASARAGAPLNAIEVEVGGERGLARAESLLTLGLLQEAGWEVEGLAGGYAERRDVVRLLVLARWSADRDLVAQALVAGRRARDLAGGLMALPRVGQRQVYPAGWGDIAFEEAGRRGLDPLLLLGLVRQESSFNPRAVSSARATGLTQVTPPTGADIAQRLGREGFATADLMRPGVSLEFGAYYLAAQLTAWDGRIFPSLAAYNAGGGNAAPWVRAWGEDPDLLVERIPFTETQNYLKLVYENYKLYEGLYR